jgi:hypothetical protein
MRRDYNNKDEWFYKTHAIPFGELNKALRKLPRKHWARIGLLIYNFTGARISELDTMFRENLHDNNQYWQCGKNQYGSWRNEYYPDWFVEELKEYWNENRMPPNKVFQMSAASFRRRFNKEIRPMLGDKWLETSAKPMTKNNKLSFTDEYKFQLKSFRKNFATIFFAKFYKKYNDASLARRMVGARMKHDTERIPDYHYILEMEQIGIEKYIEMNLNPLEFTTRIAQPPLLDFFCDLVSHKAI